MLCPRLDRRGARLRPAARELAAAAAHYPAGKARVRPLVFLRQPGRAKPPAGLRVYGLAEICAP